jgi:hypothetical protein
MERALTRIKQIAIDQLRSASPNKPTAVALKPTAVARRLLPLRLSKLARSGGVDPETVVKVLYAAYMGTRKSFMMASSRLRHMVVKRYVNAGAQGCVELVVPETPAATYPSPLVIGNGYFGTVFSVKHAVNGHCAVKVVSLFNDTSLTDFETELDMSKRAAACGAGPTVFDAFICVSPSSRPTHTYHGVLVTRHIQPSKTLRQWRNLADPTQVRAAEELAKRKLAVLHAVGVTHGDAHAGNVLVQHHKGKKLVVKDVFIVDYGFASNEQKRRVGDLSDLANLVDGRHPRSALDPDVLFPDALTLTLA